MTFLCIRVIFKDSLGVQGEVNRMDMAGKGNKI